MTINKYVLYLVVLVVVALLMMGSRLWAVLTICNGNRQFREIERSILGITTRMLSNELKEMELNNLVKRNVYAGTPVLIEYEPTEYCRTFGKIIQSMISWGREHRKMITKKKA